MISAGPGSLPSLFRRRLTRTSTDRRSALSGVRLITLINTSRAIFCEGVCSDESAAKQLALVGRQVAEFAALALRDPAIGETA